MFSVIFSMSCIIPYHHTWERLSLVQKCNLKALSRVTPSADFLSLYVCRWSTRRSTRNPSGSVRLVPTHLWSSMSKTWALSCLRWVSVMTAVMNFVLEKWSCSLGMCHNEYQRRVSTKAVLDDRPRLRKWQKCHNDVIYMSNWVCSNHTRRRS